MQRLCFFVAEYGEPADNPINALWAMRSSLDVVVSMRGVPTVFPEASVV